LPDLANLPIYDLARRAPDGSPSGVSQTGGVEMGRPISNPTTP